MHGMDLLDLLVTCCQLRFPGTLAHKSDTAQTSDTTRLQGQPRTRSERRTFEAVVEEYASANRTLRVLGVFCQVSG